MTRHQPLTVIVPTGNRIDVIENCLRSVRWADELLVVDSFSTDGSYELAKQYADRVLRHEYINSANQKNWAIPQATHDWVLIVDTDERVSPDLRGEIEAILSQSENDIQTGYRIPRLNYLWGNPVYHGGYYPDYQTRLFKRDCARYETRQVHAHILLNGSYGTLQSPIIHFAHRSINQALSNLLLQMTTWEAEHRIDQAHEADHIPTRHLLFNLVLRPIAAFWLRFVRQQAFRDGYRGLIVSLIWAMYVSITYMKVWEQELQLPAEWWHGE